MNEITSQPIIDDGGQQSQATNIAVQPERQIAAAPPTEAFSILGIIAQAATDPRVDVVKMQALLDMQERVLAKQAEADFNAALARMNTDKLRVSKNGTVELGAGKGSYKFARWEDMDKVIRPVMQREGFTLSFNSVAKEGGGITVIGTLLHSGGHSKSASIPLALDAGPGRNNLQAMGSTLSYGKRYTAEMLLNIVREDEPDDDGKRGGAQYVTDGQAEQIANMVSETDSDPREFMRWVFGDGEAHTYADIPAADFTRTLNALISKKRKQDAEKTKEAAQ